MRWTGVGACTSGYVASFGKVLRLVAKLTRHVAGLAGPVAILGVDMVTHNSP
jgi:hypothetical protein